MSTASLPKLTKQELLDAIREGVSDAVWRMITNATSMPCHDFYDAVKAGVAEAHEKISAPSPGG